MTQQHIVSSVICVSGNEKIEDEKFDYLNLCTEDTEMFTSYFFLVFPLFVSPSGSVMSVLHKLCLC